MFLFLSFFYFKDDEGVFQLLSCGADKHIMFHTSQEVRLIKSVRDWFFKEMLITISLRRGS